MNETGNSSYFTVSGAVEQENKQGQHEKSK